MEEGCRIEIVGFNKVTYVSYIDKVLEDTLTINCPQVYGENVKINLNESYDVLAYTSNQLLSYKCVVEENLQNFMYKLRIMSPLKKVQRRLFYRSLTIMSLNFYILSDNNRVLSKLHSGLVKDISVGGIRFVSNEDIVETKIKCLVNLECNEVMIFGYIIDKKFFPKSNFKYQYRIRFYDVEDDIKEKINTVIFSQKLKMI